MYNPVKKQLKPEHVYNFPSQNTFCTAGELIIKRFSRKNVCTNKIIKIHFNLIQHHK